MRKGERERGKEGEGEGEMGQKGISFMSVDMELSKKADFRFPLQDTSGLRSCKSLIECLISLRSGITFEKFNA